MGTYKTLAIAFLLFPIFLFGQKYQDDNLYGKTVNRIDILYTMGVPGDTVIPTSKKNHPHIAVVNDSLYVWSVTAQIWYSTGIGGGGGGANNYPTSLNFNTSTGDLTIGRNGLSTLTKDLDGRYLLISDTTGRWLSNFTANIPLDYTGGILSIPVATSLADGYLDNSDFLYFSNKLNPSRQVNTLHSVVGGGPLTADLFIALRNDVASPGASKYYGTNVSGLKGWFALPAGGAAEELDPTVDDIIKAIPVSADATTNKYLNWDGSAYIRKQINYADLSGTPSGSRFGISGEDDVATANRSFNANYNNFNIQKLDYFYLKSGTGSRFTYLDFDSTYNSFYTTNGTQTHNRITKTDKTVTASYYDSSQDGFGLVTHADSLMLGKTTGEFPHHYGKQLKITQDSVMLKYIARVASPSWVLSYDSTTKQVTYSPFSGSAATPTWQQTLTAGATLTGDNTVVNGANTLEITNNSLAGDKGLYITSNSTAAASNGQQLFRVALTGANATSGQATWGGFISNAHTGTSSQNTALEVSATSGSTNYGLITTATGSGNRAIFSDGNLQFTNLASSSDTTTYKPMGIDGSGNALKMNYWFGGGGGSQTFQNVLTNGSTTTTNNTVTLGANNFTWTSTSAGITSQSSITAGATGLNKLSSTDGTLTGEVYTDYLGNATLKSTNTSGQYSNVEVSNGQITSFGRNAAGTFQSTVQQTPFGVEYSMANTGGPIDLDLRLHQLPSTTTANILYYNSTNGVITQGAAPGAGYTDNDAQAAITLERPITIENPSTSENIFMFRTDVAITITKAADAVVGTGSPSVTWQIKYASTRDDGSPTNLFSASRTTTSTSGVTTTTFNDATIPAGSWIWITTSANGGTVTELDINLTYTID